MSASAPTLVSVLVPAYNEEANVDAVYNAIVKVFDALPTYEFEAIFTDNHSSDRTFDRLAAIARSDSRVKVIRFSRNYGYERSLLTAYRNATGACSVQLDCDLQDPPELIPEMLELWREGNQVVYGVRKTLQDGFFVAASRRTYYRFIAWLSDDELPVDAGEFRLVDRCILDELAKVNDITPYIRGLISSMGFKQVGIPYDRRDRTAGESKFPLSKMVSLAVDGFLNHSMLPLRLASFLGIAIGMISLLLSFGYIVGRFFFGQEWPAGFATTTILLLMSISINAIFMGILGEYIGRLFLQSKKSAPPIVEAQLNFGDPQVEGERITSREIQ